ncbi:MAG: hypothetical protein AAFV80_00870 [Bacteroidota bacterium]
MKTVLKILKWLVLAIVVMLLVAFIMLKVNSERLPEGTPSAEADQLAKEMMAAVNVAAWDSTQFVKWNFSGREQLLWDKERNLAIVEWDEGKYKAYINNDEIDGKVFENGQLVEAEKADDLIRSAWRKVQNDAFWLNAPAKAFDPGTTRSLVTVKDGREGLMVSYSSGGVTPGDSYVWILDEHNKPIAWKMWVKIIPIGGLETSWEDYKTLYSGAEVAQKHMPNFMKRGLELTDIEAAETYQELGFDSDPFAPLFE